MKWSRLVQKLNCGVQVERNGIEPVTLQSEELRHFQYHVFHIITELLNNKLTFIKNVFKSRYNISYTIQILTNIYVVWFNPPLISSPSTSLAQFSWQPSPSHMPPLSQRSSFARSQALCPRNPPPSSCAGSRQSLESVCEERDV